MTPMDPELKRYILDRARYVSESIRPFWNDPLVSDEDVQAMIMGFRDKFERRAKYRGTYALKGGEA